MVFHTMEDFLRIFPRYGKLFSTVWKMLGVWRGAGAEFSTLWKTFCGFFHAMENFFPHCGTSAGNACFQPARGGCFGTVERSALRVMASRISPFYGVRFSYGRELPYVGGGGFGTVVFLVLRAVFVAGRTSTCRNGVAGGEGPLPFWRGFERHLVGPP